VSVAVPKGARRNAPMKLPNSAGAVRQRKYRPDTLMPGLRIFVKARRQALNADFTDNAGAIHSVKRIVDLLGERLCFPQHSHIDNIKVDSALEISKAAHRARRSGEPVRIEHVAPRIDLARRVCEMVERGATDKAVLNYIARNFRLVVVTPAEAATIDRANKSRIAPDRLAGIVLHRRSTA
jgi:hypothetical protein